MSYDETNKIPVTKVLSLSIGHITADTNRWLQDQVYPNLIVYEKEVYGFWILVPDEGDDEIDTASIPVDLREVLKLAATLNCEWVMLDSINDIIEVLPTYCW